MTQSDRANAEASRELAQEAQSEAPSVYTILRELVRQAELAGSGNIYASDSLSLYLSDAAAKINRLITDAYNKGFSDGKKIPSKYEVGDTSGNYIITERFRRVGKNTKYKVVCILCGAPMFRYSNKFNLKHRDCAALSNNLSKGDGDE